MLLPMLLLLWLQERVRSAGGFVFWNGGSARIMGVLSMSRAIGDGCLKPYGLIATPDVSEATEL